MSKNVIFCFSGTGNCLDIAKNIAKGLGDTDIVMMRREPTVTDVRFCERVGFVFPCHAGGLPLGLDEQLRKLSVKPNPYTFGVVSCAAYPGIGIAQLNAIIPLDYWAVVPHQSACIWLMPHALTIPPRTPRRAQRHAEERCAAIAEELKAYTHKSVGAPNPINRAENRLWPALAKNKAEQFSVTGKCVGCGQCVSLCPRGNIRLVGGRPDFGTDCIQCLSCLQFCPRQAINLGGNTVTRERWHNPNVSAQDLNEAVFHIE